MPDVLLVCKFALSSPEPLTSWEKVRGEIEAILTRNGYNVRGAHLEDIAGNNISHQIGSDVFEHLRGKS